MLDPISSHAIDLTEAAYDLEKTDADWLASIIEVGAPALVPLHRGTNEHRNRTIRARRNPC